MSVITIVGAGMMGSAMSIPSSDNGHKVRIVGTPLDREIIEEAKKSGHHITLKRQLPENIEYYHAEELGKALKDCAAQYSQNTAGFIRNKRLAVKGGRNADFAARLSFGKAGL